MIWRKPKFQTSMLLIKTKLKQHIKITSPNPNKSEPKTQQSSLKQINHEHIDYKKKPKQIQIVENR